MYSAAEIGAQGLCPDVPTITSFLSGIIPSIHIFCVFHDGGSPIGKYFGNDTNLAAEFARERNVAHCNVYFSVNEPAPDCGHKPTKAQIVRIRAAHVDIDPYKFGAEVDKAASLRAVAADNPSLVIDSGNGLHAYWILAEAVAATPDNVDAIESVNRSLVARYGGDPAAVNVDRVLRVPGTVNWPNAKKRALGRVPCMTKVLS